MTPDSERFAEADIELEHYRFHFRTHRSEAKITVHFYYLVCNYISVNDIASYVSRICFRCGDSHFSF